MNRAETARAVVVLDAIAAAAKARASTYRDVLTGQAVAELDDNGSAPTWRIRDVGTVSLSVTQDSVAVDNETLFAQWVAVNWPHNVVQSIRPAFRMKVLDNMKVNGGSYVDDDGTMHDVPGVGFVSGGKARNISIRAAQALKDLVNVEVAKRVDALSLGADLSAIGFGDHDE